MKIHTLFSLTIAGLLLLAASGSRKAFAQQSLPARPNIVLIMVDDMGYGDLGCYGQQQIQTPHIDSLARQGMRFTRYYAGSTVCAPSREALLTGMHTGHTYIRGNFLTDEQEDPAMPPEKVTIAERLKSAGYRTALIGKWGLGGEGHGPATQGFDYSYGYLDQIRAHNYYPPFLYENGKKVMLEQNAGGKKGAYSHHLFVEKTLAFLDSTPKDQPFFLYLPYTIPHGKHVIPDNSAYAGRDWPEPFKNYAAMITLLDSDIARIINTLREKGLDRNTLILFTSDNGANPQFARFFNSNGPLRGHKTNLYEGGIREPFIACWPGKIKAGQVADHVAAGWDVLPTICQAAGLPAPAGMDGISFYPTLLNTGEQARHPYLYWEYYTYNYNWNKPGNGSERPRNWLHSRALQFDHWKAVIKSTPTDREGTVELFDLAADRAESRDLASAHPELVKKVRKMLAEASRADAPFFPYKRLHTINTRSAADLKDFIRYTPDRIPFVCSHRGGAGKGFPENCIATFEHTLSKTPSMLEIDPRYTKDSNIVLMHDPTLDRTTNGHGKVSDYTLAELKQLRLKDTEGKLTSYTIPTLDEALQWARGKTILVIDAKDVPIEARARKVVQNNATGHAILISYSLEDTRKCYAFNKNLVMEVMMGKEENVAMQDSSGVPWENVIAFVSHQLPDSKAIFDTVHQRGAMCILGSSRNIDRQYTAGEISAAELKEGYLNLIRQGADVIEADLGMACGAALMPLQNAASPKAKYFRHQGE